ncbi:MAG TPA: class I SAM-dependent methyltransferase [Streptosporangiaceae bacterium]
MADLAELLGCWQSDLASWAIPEHITAAVADSPWVVPRQVFARRADRVAGEPSGPSFEQASAALEPSGSVLDIGSGPGAASLPLLPMTTSLTAVDSDAAMLELLAARAAPSGVPVRTVLGSWPQVAPEVAAADLVTCHHVTYNVPQIGPFVTALTGYAGRLVVVEMTASHPLASLNPLWQRFHDLRRPQAPTAGDFIAIVAAMGLSPRHQAWRRPGGRDYGSFAELTDVTRRRLCLPPERSAEVASALAEQGADPDHPADPAWGFREVVTIWWDGRAAA